MKAEQNMQDKQSQCECFIDKLNETTFLLNEQKKRRNKIMLECKTENNKEYTTIITVIPQLENDISNFKYEIQKLENSSDKNTEVSYDSQSILSSSSVTKKDSKLLIDIPEGYFTSKENHKNQN